MDATTEDPSSPSGPPSPTASRARSSAVEIVLLERVALGARVQPAIAVGLALGVVTWLGLSATSWTTLRFFLATLVAVVGGVAAWVIALNRGRPDRSLVRPADLPVHLDVDAEGLHLVEDRGPTETISWHEPHAFAVWSDPTGRPMCARVANRDMTWTLVGGLGGETPDGVPTVQLTPVSSAYARTDALARRHAPWEAMLSVGEGADPLTRLRDARASARSTPCWHVPLDAEFDPTARWSLWLEPGRLRLEHGAASDDQIDLARPFTTDVTAIEASVLPGTPPRVLRRFDLAQGESRVRFSIDPGAVSDPGGPVPSTAISAQLPYTDQPRLVPPDWAPLVLTHLGLDADGRTV